MAVTMTERAANHVAGFLQRRGKGIGLRLGVRTTGCSGMAYKLEYADTENPDDQSFESHGVRILTGVTGIHASVVPPVRDPNERPLGARPMLTIKYAL